MANKVFKLCIILIAITLTLILNLILIHFNLPSIIGVILSACLGYRIGVYFRDNE